MLKLSDIMRNLGLLGEGQSIAYSLTTISTVCWVTKRYWLLLMLYNKETI
jgi:hypothetical protein